MSLDRVALLNRQIHALEDELRKSPKPRCRAEWIARFRLEAKIKRLRGEREQFPLFGARHDV